MDINYLLHRHQVSLMRAAAAGSDEARAAHRRFASAYAARIDEAQTLVGGRDLVRHDAR